MTDTHLPPPPGRGQLLRRLVVFQIKLGLDGLRDLLLSPASIVAVLIGMVAGGPRPDHLFRRLLAFGHRSDEWIDLFEARAAPDRAGAAEQAQAADPTQGASAVIDAMERIVREEYARGGGRPAIERRLRTLLRGADRNQGASREADEAYDRES